MRVKPYLMTFLMLILVAPLPAQAGTIRVLHNYLLGKAHGSLIIAKVVFDDTGNTEPGGFGIFSVRFYRKRGNKQYLIADKSAGSGIAKETKIVAQDFLALGRKQVFISAEMGAITTRIFDYDGRKVRILYANLGGRVAVSPGKSRHGKFRIIKDWPDRQFEYDGFENLGLGYKVAGNYIRRILHWNGRKFVPDIPGPTRVGKRPRGFPIRHATG